MDEPLSNLDAQLRVQTRTEIARIQQRLGTTMIYVTHDQIEALTLGDRIAVLRAGALQQVGTPADLYGHPENLFVAGFIGSPSMNFLPGRLDNETLRIAIGDIPVSDRLRRRLKSGAWRRGGREVIVGIRPEQFEDATLVGDRSRGGIFKTEIDALESVGSEYYAHFVVDSERVSSGELEELAQDTGAADLAKHGEGIQMVARLAAASRVKEHGEAQIWFDTDQLQLFDVESGRSLLADDALQPAPAIPLSATG
jgi:multiple sugar transport system ATP-binding protein